MMKSTIFFILCSMFIVSVVGVLDEDLIPPDDVLDDCEVLQMSKDLMERVLKRYKPKAGSTLLKFVAKPKEDKEKAKPKEDKEKDWASVLSKNQTLLDKVISKAKTKTDSELQLKDFFSCDVLGAFRTKWNLDARAAITDYDHFEYKVVKKNFQSPDNTLRYVLHLRPISDKNKEIMKNLIQKHEAKEKQKYEELKAKLEKESEERKKKLEEQQENNPNNDVPTEDMIQLFEKATLAKKHFGGFKDVWMENGHILARENDQSEIIEIKNEDDIIKKIKIKKTNK